MSRCDNGLADGARCNLPAAAGYNPLALCAGCLAAYRVEQRALGPSLAPDGDEPVLVVEPGVASAQRGGERPSSGAGTVRGYPAPPGGVPVLGRDFSVGSGA